MPYGSEMPWWEQKKRLNIQAKPKKTLPKKGKRMRSEKKEELQLAQSLGGFFVAQFLVLDSSRKPLIDWADLTWILYFQAH